MRVPEKGECHFFLCEQRYFLSNCVTLRLSNNSWIQVVLKCCSYSGNNSFSFAESTQVYIRKLTTLRIRSFVHGHPFLIAHKMTFTRCIATNYFRPRTSFLACPLQSFLLQLHWDRNNVFLAGTSTPQDDLQKPHWHRDLNLNSHGLLRPTPTLQVVRVVLLHQGCGYGQSIFFYPHQHFKMTSSSSLDAIPLVPTGMRF